MNLQRPSCAVVVALIATQVLGPAMLWAADQRSIQIEETRRVVVAALSGEQLTIQNNGDNKSLHFREAVNVGDQLATGHDTRAEVLVGNRAVVLLDHDTTAQFTTVSDEQTTIQVSHGLVRIAAASSALGKQGMVTVQTPTGQVQTRGGIIRVLVDQPAGAAEHTPIGEAKPYRASYSSSTVVAAITPRSELIQVEEGSAEVLVDGKAMTVPAGQAVTIQSGQSGAISKIDNHGGLRADVLATAGHSQTPKEGRDHLVALQVEQATALGNALTGAKETGSGEAGKKDDSKNVINGATGGVTLSSLVSSLFGGGSTANTPTNSPQDRLGAGFGGNNNNGFGEASADGVSVKVNGGNALLVFTRKDPVQSYVKEDITLEQFDIDFSSERPTTITPKDPPEFTSYKKDSLCGDGCLGDHLNSYDSQGRFRNQFDGNYVVHENVVFRGLPSVESKFTVVKELVLVGGTSNTGHGGIAPTETLIIRGAAKDPNGSAKSFLNIAQDPSSALTDGLFPTDRFPADIGLFSLPPREIVRANSTFVVETGSTRVPPPGVDGEPFIIGGTLGQFSNLSNPSPNGIAVDNFPNGVSHVDGAITATGSNVVLIHVDPDTGKEKVAGGVTLDQGTQATIGMTAATSKYFASLPPANKDAKFSGSLLAVIGGNSQKTSLTVGDRLLGVYDGSTIDTEGGNKALLSVLDAKLKGPPASIPLIDIAAGSHFDRKGVVTPGREPNVTVTSALVTRSTIGLDKTETIQLDQALLEASAPLFALTQATMTTTSHFADLAGNKAPSLLLNDALVALNASTLTIQNGHLLNLNAATATVNGYLFSLNSSSTLTLNHGALFSVTDHSSLNLNGNAFGVFGSGTNTLSITNNLCAAACGQLLDSTGQAFTMHIGGPTGALSPILVAGTTQNVVLPNGFHPFATTGTGTPVATMGDTKTALFTVDGTSSLTIHGTTVVKP